ncbi:uncharacterized protein KIAA0930 homolog isoform X2 [Octopus sinensis]|uniref:Uncharacterized protein KIAA0930 homolog isoform X2 n=1 Tax=Octopus sinensis TaxID=2607531 RepID=A0A7E6FMX6_9MOLL|nr:uncharacterized protein KIAA0930 homolog isoform X2 [Octopus sinensis]
MADDEEERVEEDANNDASDEYSDSGEQITLPTCVEQTSLQRMLTSIAAERTREYPALNISNSIEVVSTNKFWTTLFTEYFIEGSINDDERDDMVFYVRKSHINRGRIPQIQTEIQVYRRDSKKLPALVDRGIDWEETVYLNLILHQFEYTVTCAICTRTSDKDLQILKKFAQKVYPSPSRRRMDSKGTEEAIAYPNIFFSVDNFEEAFADIIVRDSEIICVELVATDHDGKFQGVIFLGSIKYEALKKVYDARASLTSRWAHTMSLGWFKGHKRVEFVRMRGPHGKGFAEMAVSRVKGSGPETPDTENFPVDAFADEEQNSYNERRMSDPSSAVGGTFMRGSFRKLNIRKSRSETENVDNIGTDNCHEVEAAAIQDVSSPGGRKRTVRSLKLKHHMLMCCVRPQRELAETEQYNGFWGSSFGQPWHWFKERRRATSVALHAYLTYVTLPWYRIIADDKVFGAAPKFWTQQRSQTATANDHNQFSDLGKKTKLFRTKTTKSNIKNYIKDFKK